MPRTIAIVRAGDASLHMSWASQPRNFDVGVSYFGQDADRRFEEADYVDRTSGGKWEGLYRFFERFPAILQTYDYFWLPDDDISATAADVEALSRTAQQYRLHALQPSLDVNSYYAHLITLSHPGFALRYTNFVETMVPMISRPVLQAMLPLFREARFGFGFDYLFAQYAFDLAGDPQRMAAVVDTVTVEHTRPVGGALHSYASKAGGRSAIDELTDFMAYVREEKRARIGGVAVPRIRTLLGIRPDGTPVDGMRLANGLASTLLRHHHNRRHPISAAAAARHALKSLMN